MREGIFKLQAGSEVPQRFNGQEIRYPVPEKVSELTGLLGASGVSVSMTGDPAEVEKFEKTLVSVFNEGFVLNHRQKIAKRLSQAEGATVESITKGMLAHVPGARTARDGTPREPSKLRKERETVDEMLAALPPEQRAKYEARLAELRKRQSKPKAAPAAEGASAPAAAAPAAEAPKQGGKGGKK